MAQENIRYYDVSISQNNAPEVLNGQDIRVDDLLGMQYKNDSQIFESHDMLKNIGSYDFDPLCLKKSTHWERAMRTMIFSISRQIASREELKKGRQIIERLPKKFKQNVDRDFVISFLPYILVGFNTHQETHFINESNSVENASQFIQLVYENYHASTLSFLCAHREATEVKPDSLVDNIVVSKAKRTINLQHGLFANSLIKTADLVWYQQPPSEMASSNMFPEMFLSYLNKGQIPEMILQLDRHYEQMTKLVQEDNMSNVRHHLHELDGYSGEFEEYLQSQFGSDWRLRGLNMPINISMNTWANLTDYAHQDALPSIERFTPFFLEAKRRTLINANKVSENLQNAQDLDAKGSRLSSGLSIADTTQRAIDWFNQNMDMSADTKSKFEVLFYYYWGQLSASKNMIGIGIDRDYDQYQPEAWGLGYNELNSSKDISSAPLIYARRTTKEREVSTLRDISFRQFWRNE